MLKRILMAACSLPLTLAGFAAQLTATLQSGDNVTPFYGTDAFVNAYDAAVDGDVVSLSSGKFNVPSEISKSISVTGTYAFDTDTSKATHLGAATVSGNNITLEGLRFTSTLTIKGTEGLALTRCYVLTLADAEKEGHKYHDNTNLMDCLVDDFQAMELSRNAVMRNCCINHFTDMNESANPALIENCNIPLFESFYDGDYIGYKQPYAIYRHCLLGLYEYRSNRSQGTPTLNFSAPSEFHSNLWFESYYWLAGTSYNIEWIKNYGTASNSSNETVYSYRIYSETDLYYLNSFESKTNNGVSYGPVDHKEYPAVPAIISAEIDTETDADGKLHVKINAEVRD